MKLDFGHWHHNQITGKWQPDVGLMAAAWEAEKFHDVSLPIRLQQFPDSACSLLAGLQRVDSGRAKVE